MVLRVVVFLFLSPLNNDKGHFHNIEFLAANGRPPFTGETTQANHPPLYYLLAAPLLLIGGGPKAIQVLSLLLSMGTLLVLYRLIVRPGIIAGRQAQTFSLWLACFLPQFVMNGLYIGNDTLAVFLGAVTTAQLVRLIRKPGIKEVVLVAVYTGLGLLTKLTFLAFLPVFLAAVALAMGWQGKSLARVSGAMFLFVVVALGLGSYKFVENYVRLGNPLTLGPESAYPWVEIQRQSYRGAASYLDFNVPKLLFSPIVSDDTKGAYPLLLYATFWYQHIPESSFIGNHRAPFNYLGSLLYVLGLVPTAVCLLGALRMMKSAPSSLAAFRADASGATDRVVKLAILALFLSNLALVFASVAKYQVWSIMQARLFFPSFLGMLVAFDEGTRALEALPRLSRIHLSVLRGLVALFFLYFVSEIGYKIAVFVYPGLDPWLKSISTRPS